MGPSPQDPKSRRCPSPPGRLLRLSVFPPLLALLLFSPPTWAQSRRPVTLSFGTHALTAPWYLGPMASGLNPAVFLGTGNGIESGESWRFFSGVKLGFFRHRWWMTGISIEPELGVGRSFGGGFYGDLKIGFGYLHYFWRRRTLALEEGRYVEGRSWGRPSLVLPLSASIGFLGDPDDPLTVAPFLTGRWGIQGLFLDEVPVMTHFFLLGGVRIQEEGPNPTGGM